MYSGKPIIMAGNIGENVIELANCGIVVKPNDHQAIFEAIVKLRDMDSEERKRLGDNGREYVMRNNDFNILTTRYEEIFNFLYS
jgi:glycosyltransferase involved in cell wall biosynthesis